MKKRILVTEDDPGLQDIYKFIFEKAGYEVALSADAGCIYADSFIEPDIIILDRYLVGIDGLDVCRFLKTKANTSTIPVIMVSSSPGINILAKQAGADDSMEKPFMMNDLLLKVRKWVSNHN